MHRIAKAHRSHAQYLQHRESLADSDDDDGPQDDDAWLYEDLKVLAHLYSRLRDREQLIELIFEVIVPTFLNNRLIFFPGIHSGVTQGHYYDLLCTLSTGVSSCFHRRLSK